MAIVITNKTLVDGPQLALIQFTGYFPSTTGEETDAIKVDASALSGAPTLLKIMRMWYSNTLAGTILEFDGATDGLAFPLPIEAAGYCDFRSIGGIRDNATTPTGDITLTTAATVAAVGDAYLVLIEVSKS